MSVEQPSEQTIVESTDKTLSGSERASVPNTLTFKQETIAKDTLETLEPQISLPILKNQPLPLPFSTHSVLFNNTCRSISLILQHKLFRPKYTSVEAYFRSRWGCSRAQAYRFADCFNTLEECETPKPHKIRICQLLKKYTDFKGIRALWGKVLKEARKVDFDGYMENIQWQLFISASNVSSVETVSEQPEQRILRKRLRSDTKDTLTLKKVKEEKEAKYSQMVELDDAMKKIPHDGKSTWMII